MTPEFSDPWAKVNGFDSKYIFALMALDSFFTSNKLTFNEGIAAINDSPAAVAVLANALGFDTAADLFGLMDIGPKCND